MISRRKRGRPAFKEPTIAKTYCFFEKDIHKMLNIGATPKEIFRLGILAKDNNPQIIQRVGEVEIDNSKIVQKLQRTSTRLWELQEEIKRLKNEN